MGKNSTMKNIAMDSNDWCQPFKGLLHSEILLNKNYIQYWTNAMLFLFV